MHSTDGSTLHVSVWSATNGVRLPYGRPTCNSACYSPLAFFNVSNLDLRRVNVETRTHLQARGRAGDWSRGRIRSRSKPFTAGSPRRSPVRTGGDAIRIKSRKNSATYRTNQLSSSKSRELQVSSSHARPRNCHTRLTEHRGPCASTPLLNLLKSRGQSFARSSPALGRRHTRRCMRPEGRPAAHKYDIHVAHTPGFPHSCMVGYLHDVVHLEAE